MFIIDNFGGFWYNVIEYDEHSFLGLRYIISPNLNTAIKYDGIILKCTCIALEL